MKKLLTLFLITAISLSLLTCCTKNNDKNTTDNTAEKPERPFEGVSILDENGNADYVLVTGDDVGFMTSDAIDNFRASLLNEISADLEITEGGSDSDPDKKEILIGNTGRAETSDAIKDLAADQYRIAVQGNKVIIAGGCDASTARGVNVFLKTLREHDYCFDKNANDVGALPTGGYLTALTNQSKNLIEVHDMSEGITVESRIWAVKINGGVAGVKYRIHKDHGEVVLGTCGGGFGGMYSYPEGELLWSTTATANNPHSIELLPNGIIAIASSAGNEVRLFNPTDENSETYDASISLSDAHGVLWDEKYQVLWAIGLNKLEAYKITLADDGTVSYERDKELSAKIPMTGAHDLAPYYGNEDALLITTSTMCLKFEKNNGRFTSAFGNFRDVHHEHVKGIGIYEDGSMVYMYPDEGGYAEWTSVSVIFLKKAGDTFEPITQVSEMGHYYKCRVWSNKYQ